MRFLLLVGLLLGGAGGTSAQTRSALPLRAAAPTPLDTAIESRAGGRSVLVAFALDAGVLAVSGLAASALITDPCETGTCHTEDAGFAVLYAGLAAGMTAGHLYADDLERALIGLGIRAAGVGLVLWGNGQSEGGSAILPDEPGYLIGVPLLLAGTAYSLVTTPRSVRDFNARPTVTAAPGVLRHGAPSLTLTVRL